MSSVCQIQLSPPHLVRVIPRRCGYSDGAPIDALRWTWTTTCLRRMREHRVPSEAVLSVLRNPQCGGALNGGAEWRIGNPICGARRLWLKLVTRRGADGVYRLLTVGRALRVPRGARVLPALLVVAVALAAAACGGAPSSSPRGASSPAPIVAVRNKAPIWALVGLGATVLLLGTGGWLLGRRAVRRARSDGRERFDAFSRTETAARAQFHDDVVEERARPREAAQAFADARQRYGFAIVPPTEACEHALEEETARHVRAITWAYACGTAGAVLVAVFVAVWAA